MIINYKTPKNLKVWSVKITWKSKAFRDGIMEMNNELWTIDLDIPKGEYYYHFIINEIVHINDPYANLFIPGKDNSLWSLMYIDKNGQRLYYDTQYSIELVNHFMSNHNIEYGDTNVIQKKSFNSFIDDLVSIRFDFANITGIHSITMLWIDPYNKIFDVSENILSQEDVPQNNILSIWFNMHLNNKAYIFTQGLWKVQLFIDGEYVTEDYFQLGQGAIYTNNGRLIINGR